MKFSQIITNFIEHIFQSFVLHIWGVMRIKVNLLLSIDFHVRPLLEAVMYSLKLLILVKFISNYHTFREGDLYHTPYILRFLVAKL